MSPARPWMKAAAMTPATSRFPRRSARGDQRLELVGAQVDLQAAVLHDCQQLAQVLGQLCADLGDVHAGLAETTGERYG